MLRLLKSFRVWFAVYKFQRVSRNYFGVELFVFSIVEQHFHPLAGTDSKVVSAVEKTKETSEEVMTIDEQAIQNVRTKLGWEIRDGYRWVGNETDSGHATTVAEQAAYNLAISQAIERIRAEVPSSPELEELLDFIREGKRGFVK